MITICPFIGTAGCSWFCCRWGAIYSRKWWCTRWPGFWYWSRTWPWYTITWWCTVRGNDMCCPLATACLIYSTDWLTLHSAPSFFQNPDKVMEIVRRNYCTCCVVMVSANFPSFLNFYLLLFHKLFNVNQSLHYDAGWVAAFMSAPQHAQALLNHVLLGPVDCCCWNRPIWVWFKHD